MLHNAFDEVNLAETPLRCEIAASAESVGEGQRREPQQDPPTT
jgi:hypothetical protein